jgi:ribosomal 50S subunit-recycling heat shock protein
MRIDKWLKTSRLIKRRTVAQMACEQGRVYINERVAKSSAVVKPGDTIHMELGSRALTVKVAEVPEKNVRAADASGLYEVVEELRRAPEVLEWLPEDEGW